MKKIDRPPNEELINDIAEIVAEIWRSGKDYTQVFDFHECSSRERWVARLFKLYEGKLEQARQETLKEVVPDSWGIVGVYYRFYPGGCECETTFITGVGFDTAKAFIKAGENETERYNRQEFAIKALTEALKSGTMPEEQ